MIENNVCRNFRTFVLLLILTLTSHTVAADKFFEPFDADSVIKKCWNISLEDRSSPNTARMRAGNLNTALCMEDIINAQFKIISDKDHEFSGPPGNKRIENLRFAIGGLFWAIYNENKACDPTCGTMWHPLHNTMYAKFLESVIRTIADVRNAHGSLRRGDWTDRPQKKVQ